MTLAQHVAAADGGDVAVGLIAGELQAPALAQGRAVGARPDLGVGAVLGRGEVGQGNAVPQLPEVVVAQGGVRRALLLSVSPFNLDSAARVSLFNKV